MSSTAISTGSTPTLTGSLRSNAASRPTARCAAMSRPKSRAKTTSAWAAAAPIPRRSMTAWCGVRTKSWRNCATAATGTQRLRGLPMHLVAQVGSLRVGIVHGDAAALAGWRFAQEALDDPRQQAWRNDVARASRIDVFASAHTCEAALRDFTLPPRRLTVVNNGAAGMPNFAGRVSASSRALPRRCRRIGRSTDLHAAASASTRSRSPTTTTPSPRGSCAAGRKARRPTSPIGGASIVGPTSLWLRPDRDETLHRHAGAGRGRRDRGGAAGAGSLCARAAPR